MEEAFQVGVTNKRELPHPSAQGLQISPGATSISQHPTAWARQTKFQSGADKGRGALQAAPTVRQRL